MPKKVFTAGSVLRAADVNEYLTTSRNVILNADFSINQRGFTSTTTSTAYGHDRWQLFASSGATYSTQAFTPGAAPVEGYEAANYARIVTSGQSGTGVFSILTQAIEDVRTLAGETAVVSFWAKAASGTPSVSVDVQQSFGSGGSPSSAVFATGGKVQINTTWQRYSITVDVPSISGKTIGTTANTSFLRVYLWVSAGTDFAARTDSLDIQSGTFDLWGVQVEEGSTATPFSRATPTIQSELAACQRYYVRMKSTNNSYTHFGQAVGLSTTQAVMPYYPAVAMREGATVTAQLTNTVGIGSHFGAALTAVSSVAIYSYDPNVITFELNTASGLAAGTRYVVLALNNTTASLAISAEF
jgi:hypothetical protein